MKSFIISLLLFSIMLGGVILNSRYLASVTDALTDSLTLLPEAPDKENTGSLSGASAIDALSSLWQAERNTVALSVSVHVVEGMDDGIELLESAYHHGRAAEYEAAQHHLSRIIRDIRRYETLSLESVF